MKKVFGMVVLSLFVVSAFGCAKKNKEKKCKALYKTLVECTGEKQPEMMFVQDCKVNYDKKAVKDLVKCGGKACPAYFTCVYGEKMGAKIYKRQQAKKAKKENKATTPKKDDKAKK
ncbi:hypothetical protein KKF84_07190 [Myxococcota bacterium]|nr:hypothetical protein [Myxococcota bacterium]MBU1535087.1 hypothetical protein [Myxococcota bacterium]